MPHLQIEQQCTETGFRCIAGVDEAGRGCLAGPVVAAAVILPQQFDLIPPGIDDSKKLSAKKREQLFFAIRHCAQATGIGYAFRDEIDELGILPASKLAMIRAIAQLPYAPDMLLIDGNQRISSPIKQRCVVKGDSISLSIAASSILAKVARDHLMTQLEDHFPQYGFAKHKGYGTKQHKLAVFEHGRCNEHRLSFRIVPDGRW